MQTSGWVISNAKTLVQAKFALFPIVPRLKIIARHRLASTLHGSSVRGNYVVRDHVDHQCKL